jgi:two-component system response regulator YesN
LASAESYCNRNRAITQPLTGHREVDKAVAYIHQHYSSDVTLKAVAALVAMDEAYFSGLFKKKTGATLIHYIQQVRIDHAKGWLEQTELSVAEIGERVGFPNANYFIKIFRRWTRRTPSEYRSDLK